MNIKTEHTFESALIQSLIDHGGYTAVNGEREDSKAKKVHPVQLQPMWIYTEMAYL